MTTTEVLRMAREALQRITTGSTRDDAHLRVSLDALPEADAALAAIDEALRAPADGEPVLSMSMFATRADYEAAARAADREVDGKAELRWVIGSRIFTQEIWPGDSRLASLKLRAAAPSAVAKLEQTPLIFSRRNAIAKELGISHDLLFVNIVREVERAHGILAPGATPGGQQGGAA
jgi:hypothetical protein